MGLDFSIITKHPAASIAIIGGGGLLLYLALSGGGGGTTEVATADPNAGAELQYAMQQLQVQGQLALAQSNNDTTIATTNSQATVQNNAIAAQLAEAQTQATVQNNALTAQITENAQNNATSQQAIDAQIAQTQLATSAQIAAVNADLAKSEASDAVTSHVADVTAAEQLGIAQVTGQTQTNLAAIAGQVQSNISANQTQVAITQANDSLAGVQAQVSGAVKQSSNSMWGSIASAGIGLLGALL